MKKYVIVILLFLLTPSFLYIEGVRLLGLESPIAKVVTPCPQKQPNLLTQCQARSGYILPSFLELASANQNTMILCILFIYFFSVQQGVNVPVFKPPKKHSNQKN